MCFPRHQEMKEPKRGCIPIQLASYIFWEVGDFHLMIFIQNKTIILGCCGIKHCIFTKQQWLLLLALPQ